MAEKQVKKPSKVKQLARDQEKEARRGLLEELLNDMYTSRQRIYWMNFVRGIFFGFGSVLGGTVLIALVVWLLARLGTVIPFLSDFIQQILDTLQMRRQ